MGKARRSDDRTDVNDLLNRFAAEEEKFLAREFLAPALRGGTVRVQIGGMVCKVRIEPADFEGWGVFQPVSHTEAILEREASLAERRKYLELFPMIRQIVCRRAGHTWFGAAASFGDTRIRMEGLAPLQLATEIQLFDCVRTRFDGTQFWFEEVDMRHDPGASAYLRSALCDETPPENLDRKGLTAEERAAYELNYWELVRPPGDDIDDEGPRRNPPHRRRSRNRQPGDMSSEATESDSVRGRLRDNLSHAGAELIDYLERADSFRVRYRVGGRQHTSSVNKDDLTVQVAGICLSGEDQKFDLASMVGVLREGDRDGGILLVGGDIGMDEEEYWNIHPPRNRP